MAETRGWMISHPSDEKKRIDDRVTKTAIRYRDAREAFRSNSATMVRKPWPYIQELRRSKSTNFPLSLLRRHVLAKS